LDLEYTASLQPLRTTFPIILRLSKFVSLPIFHKAYAAAIRIASYAQQSIQRYKKVIADNPEDPKRTLFTRLFDAGKEGLTDLEILHNAIGYIVAGTDTTAVTLTYLTYNVCRDHAIRDALVAELQSLPADFTDAQCRELPYLGQVIDETLRLHAAAPSALPRIVPPEGATLAGYQLPPGVTVSTQAYSLHRDPSIWSDPERSVTAYILKICAGPKLTRQ
jgi:cytochrome P450